jgi:predicted DNA-binding protein (MmcQ/YjbR family)
MKRESGRGGIDLRTFNALCRRLPAAAKTVQWGSSSVWKVGGKMFAVAWNNGAAGFGYSFKTSDQSFMMLCESGVASPAPYLARAQWVTLCGPDALSKAELAAYLAQAHALIAAKLPKKTRAMLGLSP